MSFINIFRIQFVSRICMVFLSTFFNKKFMTFYIELVSNSCKKAKFSFHCAFFLPNVVFELQLIYNLLIPFMEVKHIKQNKNSNI